MKWKYFSQLFSFPCLLWFIECDEYAQWCVKFMSFVLLSRPCTVTTKLRSLPFFRRTMRTPFLVLTGWWWFLIQSDHNCSDPMRRCLHHWSDTRSDDYHKQPEQPANGWKLSCILFSLPAYLATQETILNNGRRQTWNVASLKIYGQDLKAYL